MANNVKMSVKGSKLILEIDLTEKGDLTTKGTARRFASTTFFEKVEGLDGVSISVAAIRSIKAAIPKASKIAEDETPTKKVTAKPTKTIVNKTNKKTTTPAAVEDDADVEDSEIAPPKASVKKTTAKKPVKKTTNKKRAA